MRSEYDVSKAKRGAVIASPGKTRITIMLDNEVLEAFRARAEAEGRGYQTAINEALRAAIETDNAPLTVATLRAELRKALKAAKAA
jgi:uncharacterized protein (DUF4415 family)